MLPLVQTLNVNNMQSLLTVVVCGLVSACQPGSEQAIHPWYAATIEIKDLQVKQKAVRTLTSTIGNCGFTIVERDLSPDAYGRTPLFRQFIVHRTGREAVTAAVLRDAAGGTTSVSLDLYLRGFDDEAAARACLESILDEYTDLGLDEAVIAVTDAP